jgi:hypothetical protein
VGLLEAEPLVGPDQVLFQGAQAALGVGVAAMGCGSVFIGSLL